MRTRIPRGPALNAEHPNARRASSRAYRGWRIDTVTYDRGRWHVYLFAPGATEGGHDDGYSTEAKAVKAAKAAVDYQHQKNTPSATEKAPAWIR